MGVNSCVLECERVFVHVFCCMHVGMKILEQYGYWWVSVGMHVSYKCMLIGVCVHVSVYVLER